MKAEISAVDRVMMAISFAEANEEKTALEILHTVNPSGCMGAASETPVIASGCQQSRKMKKSP